MKGRLLNATVARDGRVEIFYLLLKLAGFVGLVDSCVEQDKSSVTQNQHTNDQEKVSAPSQDGMGSRRGRDSPVEFGPHGWLLRASLAGDGLKGAE